MKTCIHFMVAALVVVAMLLLAGPRAPQAEHGATDSWPVREQEQPLPEPDVTFTVSKVEWYDPPAPQPPKPQPKARPAKVEPPRPAQPSQAEPAKAAGSGAKAAAKGGGLNIIGSYACSFDFYLLKMQSAGARVAVYDSAAGRIFIADGGGGLRESRSIPRNYSQATRRITAHHPGAGRLIREVAAQYGEGIYDIILLVPERLESRLRDIAQGGGAPRGGNVRITYAEKGGALWVVVDGARGKAPREAKFI